MKPSKNFYQWDINQKFTECDGRFVDFIINEKVVYRVDIVNGECIIPDEFLQKSGYHTVYECMSDYTIQNHMFPVHPREKPPGYVYTPTEKLTFEGLVQKVNDTVADIIHRADTGEFDGYTPVKGEDYFTEAEKNEMVQSVSSGAVGEFREVVNSATSDFNKNSSAKTNEYNTNAEKKLSTYNSNDAEKLKAYNDNHTEKMTAYDTNDADKLSTYNRNAAEKMEAYNQNHTAKVAEYNQNAETKTAEFDANAAAMQTEVDRLRGECDQLAAENRKQENRISALMKLNKGQTYDILPEEGETASRTAPSGAKYVNVDKVGGKSIVWNQLYDRTKPTESRTNGITFSHQEDGSFVATGKNIDGTMSYVYTNVNVTAGHVYFSKSIKPGDVGKSYLAGITIGSNAYDRGNGAIATASKTGIASFVVQMFENGAEAKNEVAHPRLFDLTLMFGAGNEPTAEQFNAMFPAESYQYNAGEIISSRTETITAGAETITTGFPELKSAGTAHDVIDMDGGQVIRNVYTVELETLVWNRSDNTFRAVLPAKAKASGNYNTKNNELCNKYEPITMNDLFAGNVGIATNPINGEDVWIFDSAYETPEQLVASLSGAVLHYELATPTTEPVTIPEPLQEWIPVEPGGTVTFRNADESKQLPVPNAVSWVRKLDEVN